MNTIIARAAAGVLAFALASPVLASDSMMNSMSHTVTLTGQVVDLACFLSSGAHGSNHAACAKACAKSGGSLGILTKDGNIVVSIDRGPGKNPNTLLLPYVEQTVTVMGTEYDAHGVKSIAISSVKAQAAMMNHMSH